MIITIGINEEIQFLKDLINHISDKDFEGTYINLNGRIIRVDISNREEVLLKIKERLDKLEKQKIVCGEDICKHLNDKIENQNYIYDEEAY